MYRAIIARRRSLALMLMASIPLWGNAARAQNAGQTPFVNWLSYLQTTDGYTVTQGTAVTFPGCTTFVTYFGSCFGNNKITPYVIVNPPVESTNNLPSYMQSNFSNSFGSTTTNDFYQIGNDEAIVTIITLPPQAAFYSLQTYMIEREASLYGGTAPSPTPPATFCVPGASYTTGGYTHALTPDCNYDVFGFFTNAVNNADVGAALSGTEFNTTGTTTIAIVTTPSSALFSTISAAFSAQGYGSSSQIFQEGMPAGIPSGLSASLLNTGTSSGNDIFGSIFRYALPKSQTAGDAWLGDPSSYFLVYRIKAPSAPGSLYTLPNLVANGCNTNETVASSPPTGCPTNSTYFDADLQEIATLLSGWLATNTSETYATHHFGGGGANGVGCIVYGTPCAGGTQDTADYYNFNIGELLNAGPAFVIGVNHSASTTDVTATTPVNNASYTGVSAAINIDNEGVTDIAQQNQTSTFANSPTTDPALLSGSAAQVLSDFGLSGSESTQLQTDLPNLYITIYYRSSTSNPCSGQPYCASGKNYITTIQGNDPTGLNYIPNSAAIKTTERSYLLPPSTSSSTPPTGATLTGAASSFLEAPYVVCDTAGGAC
jgi:hypothetical protein